MELLWFSTCESLLGKSHIKNNILESYYSDNNKTSHHFPLKTYFKRQPVKNRKKRNRKKRKKSKSSIKLCPLSKGHPTACLLVFMFHINIFYRRIYMPNSSCI